MAGSPKKITLILALVLFAGAVVYSVYTGTFIKKIGIPGAFELEFGERSGTVDLDKLDSLDEGVVEESQEKMKAELERLQRELQTERAAKVSSPQDEKSQPRQPAPQSKVSSQRVKKFAEPSPVKLPNLGGSWRNVQDPQLSYTVWQEGRNVTMSENHPFYGTTSVGSGNLLGNHLEVTYTTVLGTMGRVNFRVSQDGRSLSGQYTDLTTGMSQPIELVRN